MSLKITKVKGRASWYIRGSINGRRIYQSAETGDREIADLKRKKLEWELEQRAIFGDSAVATFPEAAIGYMNAGGEARFLPRILPHFKETRLVDITQIDIDRLGAIEYADAAPATLRRQWHGPILAVMNFAADNNLCPPVRIKRPATGKPRVRWLWPEEAAALVQGAPEHARAAILTFLGTGCRASELARLKWPETWLNSGEALISESKNGSSRKVELPSLSIAALSTLEHRTGHVFLTPKGKPYTVRKSSGGLFNDSLAKASKAAGIDRVTAHVLRHTWATWFYSQTRDTVRLMQLGGWSSLDMVQIYTHLAPRELSQKLTDYGWMFSFESGANSVHQSPTTSIKG